MAVPEPRRNRPLWEVLREGPESPYARWFDIDWDAGTAARCCCRCSAGRLGEERGDFRVDGEVLRY